MAGSWVSNHQSGIRPEHSLLLTRPYHVFLRHRYYNSGLFPMIYEFGKKGGIHIFFGILCLVNSEQIHTTHKRALNKNSSG